MIQRGRCSYEEVRETRADSGGVRGSVKACIHHVPTQTAWSGASTGSTTKRPRCEIENYGVPFALRLLWDLPSL